MSASALFEGWVRHRRYEPVEHEFRYPLYMSYLDLEELPGVLDRFRGFSARRPSLVRFKRSDYLGDERQPLDDAVRDAVEEQSFNRPEGPIRVLSNLRFLGHSFNPVSFYFCMDHTGERVDTVLAEVTNTPWGESHAYVLGADEENTARGRVISGRLRKAFHVSPLMGMDHTYDWRTTEPGSELVVQINSEAEGRRAFDATLSLRRQEMTPASMRRVLVRYPAMSAQVMARIYWQALRLKLKGAPYFPHPEGGHGASQ